MLNNRCQYHLSLLRVPLKLGFEASLELDAIALFVVCVVIVKQKIDLCQEAGFRRLRLQTLDQLWQVREVFDVFNVRLETVNHDSDFPIARSEEHTSELQSH